MKHLGYRPDGDQHQHFVLWRDDEWDGISTVHGVRILGGWGSFLCGVLGRLCPFDTEDDELVHRLFTVADRPGAAPRGKVDPGKERQQ